MIDYKTEDIGECVVCYYDRNSIIPKDQLPFMLMQAKEMLEKEFNKKVIILPDILSIKDGVTRENFSHIKETYIKALDEIEKSFG